MLESGTAACPPRFRINGAVVMRGSHEAGPCHRRILRNPRITDVFTSLHSSIDSHAKARGRLSAIRPHRDTSRVGPKEFRRSTAKEPAASPQTLPLQVINQAKRILHITSRKIRFILDDLAPILQQPDFSLFDAIYRHFQRTATKSPGAVITMARWSTQTAAARLFSTTNDYCGMTSASRNASPRLLSQSRCVAAIRLSLGKPFTVLCGRLTVPESAATHRSNS